MITMGMKLRQLRKQNGYRQSDISDIIGCERQALSQYENDKNKPSKEKLNKLAELYDYVIVNSPLSKKEKANKFIEMIEELNNKMNIKNNFKEIIKDEDIDSLAKKAYKEAIPLYPTPTLWDLNKFKEMLRIEVTIITFFVFF